MTEAITAEQLWKHAGQGRSELVRGELVEFEPVGHWHGKLVARILFFLLAFLEEHRVGSASTEVGVVLARAPDLAVEVLSPEDRAGKVQEKIRDYLVFGTKLVWIVDTESRTVTVYHPSGAAHVYSGSDEVTGQDILPGFFFTPEKLFAVS